MWAHAGRGGNLKNQQPPPTSKSKGILLPMLQRHRIQPVSIMGMCVTPMCGSPIAEKVGQVHQLDLKEKSIYDAPPRMIACSIAQHVPTCHHN